MSEQTAQSKATRKYEASHGWISRTYKLRKQDVDDFKAACERLGISQAGQLTKMMREFVEQQKEDDSRA